MTQGFLYKTFGVDLGMYADPSDSDNFATVRGFFTNDLKDELGDIITRGATERAIGKYRKWGNIRWMHQPKPVGKITRIGTDDGMEWNEVEIRVIDPEAVFAVKNGLVTALSVGILIDWDDLEMLEEGGFVVNDYMLTEISLVDHPANYGAQLTSIKDLASIAHMPGAEMVKSLIGDRLSGMVEIRVERPIKEGPMEEDITKSTDGEITVFVDESVEEKVEKSPACRQEGESEADCVSRKIPEILEENPDMSREQAQAIAYSVCEKACSEDSVEPEVTAAVEPELTAAAEPELTAAVDSIEEEPVIEASDPIEEDEGNDYSDISPQDLLFALMTEVDELKGLVADLRPAPEAPAEVPPAVEQPEGEGETVERAAELQARIDALETENRELQAELDRLTTPVERMGAVPETVLPEPVEEPEQEEVLGAPNDHLDGLRKGIRRAIRTRK